MGGANLEVFKFATYLFIPIFAMLHFGDPDWYEHHVAPVKARIWPKYEDTNRPPRSTPELHEELRRLKNERRAKAGLPSIDAAERPTVMESLPEQTNWASGDKRWV